MVKKNNQKNKVIIARTITITSLGEHGRQKITSSYNWRSSNDYPLKIVRKSEIRSSVEEFLKHLGQDHYSHYKKSRAKRIVKLTTDAGTFYL